MTSRIVVAIGLCAMSCSHRGPTGSAPANSALACQDLYQYANREWLASATIPPDEERWRPTDVIAEAAATAFLGLPDRDDYLRAGPDAERLTPRTRTISQRWRAATATRAQASARPASAVIVMPTHPGRTPAGRDAVILIRPGLQGEQPCVDRTAFTAAPAISFADLRGASCDHSRPTRPRITSGFG